ncbi:uncharacterized protein IL334_000392 [Kwoniella shivajii]|uniref:Uncharacterized protein n=1 Tax=Kwoniella shivajii TaxID=564305 RepID=A0ABZ1CP18_9TREE|nr:hypothetical protein IL334_000392 [Kwoniella shivajii]
MATIVDDSNWNLVWSGTSWRTEHSDDPSTGRYFNSGLYGVTVDNGNIQYFSGYSEEGQFQATLFATSGLKDGSHTLKISNENERNQDQYPDYMWLDIDSVAVSGTLINAGNSSDSTSSTISSSSSLPGSSSTQSESAESSDVVSGQYSATISSVAITSTASDTPTVTSVTSSRSSSLTDESTAVGGERNDTDRRTITLAISIPVIVISSLVILIFLGLWYKTRRKRKQGECNR